MSRSSRRAPRSSFSAAATRQTRPSGAFFEAALAALEARPDEATMVGDDVEADVGGAKALGLRAILVRTGKFREETLAAAEPKPDAVLDSVADLPAFLESSLL